MASLSSASLAVLAKANAYKQNTKSNVKETQSKAVPIKAITTKINTVQTNLSKIGLGEKTLAAQKALAEKYGIVTFDVKGNISQVPTTRPIDTTINVGTGILTNSSYNDSLAVLIQQEQAKTNTGISGNNNPILTGITDFIESFFHTSVPTDIPIEIQEQIKRIDDKILEHKKSIDSAKLEYAGRINTSNIADVNYFTNELNATVNMYQRLIDGLNGEKNKILLDYKTKVEFLPKVQSLIDSLNLYGKIDTLTPQLKTEIQDRIAQASEILEKIIGENLDITKQKIMELQQAMILAANVMQLPITAAQQTVKANMDGTAEIFDIFNLLNPAKSIDDRVKELIFDFRAQKQAMIVLLQTGEFTK